MKINGDDPAFGQFTKIGSLEKLQGGLTKRELFAAMSMQGRLANPDMFHRHGADHANVASDAVKWADALIEELNR